MARQSDRLISLGYYNQERPYKEKLKRIFHKRKHCHDSNTDPAVNETTETNTSLNDVESEYSDMSHTSIGDEWETPTPLDRPPVSIKNEAGDQPASDSVEPPNASNYGQKTKKFWRMCIAMCLLAIPLCFSTWQPFNMTRWETGYSESLTEDVLQLQHELAHLRRRLLPKGLSMPNFALESQGARILHAHPSESYQTSSQPPLLAFLSMPMVYLHHSPRIVIQDHTPLLVPGRCWSFPGQSGQLFISLSQPVRVSHVTMGHMSREHSPYEFMHSAPWHFSVSGYLSKDLEGSYLGTFEYDLKGDSFQTFEFPAPTKTFRIIKLEILSNWGHPEYTCVYSFKVHGDINL